MITMEMVRRYIVVGINTHSLSPFSPG